jgi:Asp-tRNA(Asn)/Glu-tRNA(Gln) amidotransferase A subunit family amidase
MTRDLCSLSLCAVRDLLASGQVTATEAVTACLERIQATEPALKAVLHLAADEALAGPPAWTRPARTRKNACGASRS